MNFDSRILLKNILFIQLLFLLTFSSSLVKCETKPKVYTNQFAVHLKQCDDNFADLKATQYGFRNNGKIGSLDCHYLFESHRIQKRSTDYSHSHHSMLSKDSDVVWTEQQHVKIRVKRDNLNTKYRFTNKPMPDPLYKEMWYLNKGALGGYDMNVNAVWKMGYTGKGVVVTILDDGIQPNHPDLVSNYDAQASYDINDNDPDPTPQDNGDNKHGTRCAGEVAAEAYNEFCGVGIAFNASIGGVRMLDGTVTDEVEARALSMNPNHVDIYSASWGPEDDGKTVDGPGRLAQRAFIDGIRKGRRGLGSVFIWASGNGGRRLDNCNCDGYTNSIYTLSISSATQNGQKPWYLEECSSTLATTYSSGTPGRDENVFTVDQDMNYFNSIKRGEKPDTSKLCTRSHTGTSASAPIAAAIVALALEANPTLTWRDLQHLVILSSRYEPLRHETGWMTNGVGRRFSHKFGYGLIDASAMVRFAENWTPTPVQRICETSADEREREVPVYVKRQIEVSMTTNGCRDTSNQIKYLEHVQAKISLKYKPRGSLKISLVSPSGTISHLLFPRPRDAEDSSFTNWPFLSVHFWGESAVGNWRLIIQNDGSRTARSPGKLVSWSLIFYGTYDRPASYHLSANQTIHYKPRSASSLLINMSECAKIGLIQQIDSSECVKSCPTGQYPNLEIGICQKCSEECETCFGPSSDNCLSCNEHKYFYGYHCLVKCSDGYYEDNKLNECLPCSSNCETCVSSPDNCISCKKSLTLQNNHCVKKCLSLNDSNCSNCHQSCASCNGNGINQCLSCHSSHRLIYGTCIETQCPIDFYEHSNQNGLECDRCHNTCKSCNGPSHKNCTTCFKNATLTEEGICRTCLSGQFKNSKTLKCESCHSSCSSCNGPTANDCITCKEPYFWDNSRCIPCCSQNFNTIEGLPQDFTDCCHCISLRGPCSSSIGVDRPRSISMESDMIFDKIHSDNYLQKLLSYLNPVSIVVILCISCVFIYVIVFIGLEFRDRHCRPKGHNEYRKVSTKFSSINFDNNSERLSLTADDDEEEDSLYEKT